MQKFLLEDFFPSYPQYERNEDDLFNIYDEDMYDVIKSKKEFSELKLDPYEEPSGSYLKHQLFIQRFLSIHTPYTGLLLWHEVGVGKTLSAISVIEGMKKYNNNPALVLSKGRNITDNFREQILNINPSYELDSNNEKVTIKKRNEAIALTYQMDTFRIFGRRIELYSPEKIKELYSNRVIVFDEVHNIREEDEKESRDPKKKQKLYNIFHKFLHTVENCKIILLSATPMKDRVNEFASIMNLILPSEKQIPVESFLDDYFENGKMADEKRVQLMDKVKGYISYLRQPRNETKLVINEIGEIFDEVKGFKIVPLEMEDEQSEIYETALSNDMSSEVGTGRVKIESEGGIYQSSRQAILSCYPEYKGNTYGNEKVVKKDEKVKKIVRNRVFYQNICNRIFGIQNNSDIKGLSTDEKLEKIKKYSAKYHYIIKHALDNKKHKMFVYSKYVEGSALFLLSELLDKCGIKYSEGNSVNKESRHFTITSAENPNQVVNLLKSFNREENKFGEYVQILLGSPTIGESKSLKAIRDIFILTPHWNYTETEQAIGRGIRYQSHSQLPEDQQTVNIHRLMAYPKIKDESIKLNRIHSIDYYMYDISYKKDILIKQIEDSARSIAVDCVNNIKRNKRSPEFDDTRECFYKSCDYKCSYPDEVKTEYNDTYNLFYTDVEYNVIKNCIQHLLFNSPKSSIISFTFTFSQIHKIVIQYEYPTHVIFRCIKEIIEKKESFINPHGFTCYLKEKEGLYFLSNELFTYLPSDIYDCKYGPVYPNCLHNDAIDQIELNNIPIIMNHLKTSISLLDQIHPFLLHCIFMAYIEKESLDNPVIQYGLVNGYIDRSLKMLQNYDTKLHKWTPIINPIQHVGVAEEMAIQLLMNNDIFVYGVIEQNEPFKIVYFENTDSKKTLQENKLSILKNGKKKGNDCLTYSAIHFEPLYKKILIATNKSSDIKKEQKCMSIKKYIEETYFNEPINEYSLMIDKSIHKEIKLLYSDIDKKDSPELITRKQSFRIKLEQMRIRI